jgi:ribosome recycling factor
MNPVLMYGTQFEQNIAYLRQDISSLRTGRATPAIVEDVQVEAYGIRQPLKALASISVQDAKTIVVEPWDKSVLQAVEVAIRNSSLGISPVNDGKLIRVSLPELTHERRQELIKVLAQKLEAARITIRQTREEVKKVIEMGEDDGGITEDEKFAYQEELDRLVKDYNDRIRQIGEDKEKEITTI